MSRGLVLLALAACSNSPSGGQICTDLFAYVTASVVDSTAKPVDDLIIRDSVLRTRQAFNVTDQSLGILTPGTYAIFSDSDLGDVRQGGDSVVVTGSRVSAGPAPGPGFSTTYVFGTDGCHVKKLAGPDTIIAR